jgi:hypothetical protein
MIKRNPELATCRFQRWRLAFSSTLLTAAIGRQTALGRQASLATDLTGRMGWEAVGRSTGLNGAGVP